MNTNQEREGFRMPNQSIFEQRMDEMNVDMKEMRSSMGKIAEAMTKLAVLEEKNHAFSIAIDKVSDKTERIELKTAAIELEQARMISMAQGASFTAKALWAVFGGGVLYVGGSLVLTALKHAP